jgi:hypothetical protein
MLTAAIACGLACATLTAAPALAQTAPWEPATELFSHMTGDDSGGDAGSAQLDDAIQTMVTGAVESTLEQATQAFQQPAPAPQDDPAQDGEERDGEATGGETRTGEEDTAPEAGGGEDQADGHGDDRHGDDVRFESHPVATHAQREPCEQAGGTLVEVSEHTGEEVQALGVACVPPDHPALDEHAASRRLAAQRLRDLDLPGGTITADLEEGLARLPTTLRLTGEEACPAELRLPADTVLEVTCTVVAREWFFGDDEHARISGNGTAVEHTYRTGGRYLVRVQTVRVARALLDGEPLAEETLVSAAALRYPVAELRAVLTR